MILHVPPAVMLTAPAEVMLIAPAETLRLPAAVIATPAGVIVILVPPTMMLTWAAHFMSTCSPVTETPVGSSWIVWYGPVGMGGDGTGTGDVGPF